MYKTTTFFKTAAMTVLLFMGMITAQAANITYHLTTHEVFGKTQTLEAQASLSAGASLLDNMPQTLWRAYTTYTFYADAALTEEISEAPAADATVYVDYVFDPAYIPSVEGQDPVWLLLRGYNESAENSSGNSYLLYKVHSKNEIRGYHYTGSRPKAGNNYPMAKAGHDEWAIYGDGYNCQIKLHDDAQNYWLIWGATSGTSLMKLGSRPEIGWQLYTNKAKNSRISGGTVAMGVPGTTNYIYELRNVSDDIQTASINTSQFYFNSHNELEGRQVGTSNYKTKLWWYALFAAPTMANVPNLYHVTYKILKADGTWADDIMKQKSSSNLKPTFPTNDYEQNPDYVYSFFYADEEFTEKLADDYTMPADENTVLYIKEVKPVTTTWKTLCLPFDVQDLTTVCSIDGTQALEVWEYDHVTNAGEAPYYQFQLTFVEANEIKAGYPYLYRFVKGDEAKVEKWLADLQDMQPELTADDRAKITEVAKADPASPNVNVTMVGTFDNYELAPRNADNEPYYFYFGYNQSQDKYKFYPVKTKTVNMKPFQCYFFAAGVEGSVVEFSMDGAVDGITEVAAQTKSNLKGVYNLNGQQVNSKNLPAGVYVVNGKKMVVK